MTDYEHTYNEEWRDIIEPNGTLDMDALKKELHDFSFLMSQASEVYCEVTGNRLSKTTYNASAVIGEFHAKLDDWIEEAIAEQVEDGTLIRGEIVP